MNLLKALLSKIQIQSKKARLNPIVSIEFKRASFHKIEDQLLPLKIFSLCLKNLPFY